MSLKRLVTIEERFQRAIRIDKDLESASALNGFVCPNSSLLALLNMARQIKNTGQCAFTWTGPYGSGKSSLIVALTALLNKKATVRNKAKKILGDNAAKEILSSLPPKANGWSILPIVGKKAEPTKVIGEALCKDGLLTPKDSWSDNEIIDTLLSASQKNKEKNGGLIVFIDEMGKVLEGAASQNSDIYFFQQLAETASRSNNRLIVVGVLHQAFGEYAHHLSRDMRDEWSKIQGRFIDLPINVAGEEQIDLLSRAIISQHKPEKTTHLSRQIASIVKKNKPGTSENLEQLLDACWPLHPLVACLLGPISRRRFGQNQRSLFGFLNSAEPAAFKSFLDFAKKGDLYTTDLLWDYLRLNLEPTILISPDGHRWALAAEAVERCENQVGQGLHLTLLKAVALIDLFKSNSGLMPSEDLLIASFTHHSAEEILRALEQLRKWSLIIYKKHLNSYAIFAGSDFDIEEAISKAREEIRSIDFTELKNLIGMQPILAKRHYHTTGTLRWFDMDIVPLNSTIDAAKNFAPKNGAIGQFLLAISTDNESKKFAEQTCQDAANQSSKWEVIVGLSKQSWTINDLALELLALNKVHDESNDLSGDSVARREIRANIAEQQSRLEAELNKAFDHARWYSQRNSPKNYSRRELNILTSDVADTYFHACPKIHNELLNRHKPSNSAIGGQNALLRAMVEGEGLDKLGIDGFPSERGLYSTILENTGLYTDCEYKSPETSNEDPCNLVPSWDAATKHLREYSDRAVSVAEIYEVWQQPPFGIKDGLKPVLAVAYILTQRSILAFYRDGIFQSRLRDIDVEVLAKKPEDIQLRYMNLSEVSKKLLSGMADVVRDLDDRNTLQHLEPIDVARGLIAIYDSLHPWAKRTMHLSKEAIRIRNLFKKANDPNKLLFDDIPGLLGMQANIADKKSVTDIVHFVEKGLKELKEAYPTEINKLRNIMLDELQVPNLSPNAMEALRKRAENIKDVSGDFHLEALVVRLASFEGTDMDMESIASLATNKPSRNWIDNDIDRAKIEITDLAQKFLRAETFARVKGREDKRHSLGVVVGLKGRPTPLHQDFEVSEADREQIDKLIVQLEETIGSKSQKNKNIVLAALAEMCATHIQKDKEKKIVDEKAVS